MRSFTVRAAAMAPAEVLAAGSTRPPLGTAAAPTFITTWSCPYAQRTWIALNEKGVDYKPVFVDLASKPEWFFPLNPHGRVPTLAWADGGKEDSMYESLICNEYVEDAFPGPSLLPPTPAGRAKARLLIDQFGAKVGAAFGKVMFAGSGEGGAALDEALQWLEKELDASGPFAMGSDWTLADCAMGPFIIRLGLLKEVCGYEVPASLARVARYRDAVLSRPSVKATMQPPEGGSYFEQMANTYRTYIDNRRKAAAAAAST